jgi:predicted RNA-binding Zn ribbon-like protein
MPEADPAGSVARASYREPWSRWRVSVAETGPEPLCIALANTCERRGAQRPVEHMGSVDDLLRFATRHGVCDDEAARRLARDAEARPRTAAAELAATLALREAIARLLGDRERAAPGDVALLARMFDAAQRAVRLELAAGGLTPRARGRQAGLQAVRLQAAVSAMVLLGSARSARVRRCADDRGCGRFFVDATRNGSRRYCLAGECGNRARQAAFRARHRGDAARSA